MCIQHALVVAIRGGHTEIVVVLLDFGVQANFYYDKRVRCWYKIDFSPLFTAVQFWNLELVDLPLKRGADPERYFPSPLYRAVEDGRRNIITILLKYGVGWHAAKTLKLAVLRKDESMARFFLMED
ncbi:hypothetical protein N7517_004060 [Penicillium concentricum]|uniref:Uncharacterized protein n=1 Tax=Penicillium concentricum TaxID=293559 RepID=A0A9W9V912_9EURO|nr:uncharacterized protein N7517_004060 [Penicillium concentricum]KAJ5372054.1 hypothetical protein N7517_004060 [Penicillium concentricum]